jgi:hypothetical protein
MARALLVLTPAESKKLISNAILGMPEVKKALKNGTVALHPSSSTYFIASGILGHKPPTDVWVCGAILPRGICGDVVSGVLTGSKEKAPETPTFTGHNKPFTFTWVFKKGKLEPGKPLEDVLDELGPGDFYMKGVNALDAQGNVAIFIGSSSKVHDEVGGTIGRAMSSAKTKGFQVIFPVGLEKLIPVSIKEAAQAGKQPKNYSYTMGHTSALLPGEGRSITEIDAFKLISGVKATPIAGGGLQGAEGAHVFVIEGEQEQIDKAVAEAEEAKGAKLPQVRERNCMTCERTCDMAGQSKPWLV